MVYQNNNHRVNPDVVKNITLQPQASPVDKTIHYQPKVEKVVKYRNTAESLAKLGQGLLDIEPVWKRQAEEAIINAKAEAELQGGNKSEWASVSRHVHGMAKFNPYIKDAYKSSQAGDIVKAGTLEMLTIQSSEQLSPDNYNVQLKAIQNKTIKALTESGLAPKDYEGHLMLMNNTFDRARAKQFEENAKYEYKSALIKKSSDLGTQLRLDSYNSTDEFTSYKTTLNNFIEQSIKDGIPDADLAATVFAGLKGYIANNADSINSVQLGQVLKEVKINGKNMDEVIPNFNAEVTNFIREAKRAAYGDRELEYQSEQLDLKIKSKEANAEIYNWYKQNPKATPEQMYNELNLVIGKYGLQEVGLDFLKGGLVDKRQLTELMTIESDPSILQSLGAKAASGTLTPQDISDAYSSGNLNWKDGLQFSDRLDRGAKAEVKEIENDYKQLASNLKPTGLYGSVLKNTQAGKDFARDANQVLLDLDNGKITTEQAKNKLAAINRIAAIKAQQIQNRHKNYNVLLNANYVRSQQLPSYNFNQASQAFKKLGYIRGGAGQRINGNITSGINSNRTINGNPAPHRGYDIGASNGTPIRNCNMQGTVVSAGRLNDFGNYVVIKYANGTYARMGHLKNYTGNLQGKSLAPNQTIGYVGNTGNSTGSHLHVDFWNKNLELINAETFAKGIR